MASKERYDWQKIVAPCPICGQQITKQIEIIGIDRFEAFLECDKCHCCALWTNQSYESHKNSMNRNKPHQLHWVYHNETNYSMIV